MGRFTLWVSIGIFNWKLTKQRATHLLEAAEMRSALIQGGGGI